MGRTCEIAPCFERPETHVLLTHRHLIKVDGKISAVLWSVVCVVCGLVVGGWGSGSVPGSNSRLRVPGSGSGIRYSNSGVQLCKLQFSDCGVQLFKFRVVSGQGRYDLATVRVRCQGENPRGRALGERYALVRPQVED